MSCFLVIFCFLNVKQHGLVALGSFFSQKQKQTDKGEILIEHTMKSHLRISLSAGHNSGRNGGASEHDRGLRL